MKGKVIKVIGSSSVFKQFLGRYGVVLDKAYGDKWVVEFNASAEGLGALSHTVSEKDFEVVGDTVRGDYKERFKAEYYQLEDRMTKLGNMLDKWDNGTLEFEPTCEKELLKDQFYTMRKYLTVLELRAKKEDIKL